MLVVPELRNIYQLLNEVNVATEALSLLDEMIELHRRVTEYNEERNNGHADIPAPRPAIQGTGIVSAPAGLTLAEPVKRGRGRPRKVDPQLQVIEPEQPTA